MAIIAVERLDAGNEALTFANIHPCFDSSASSGHQSDAAMGWSSKFSLRLFGADYYGAYAS
ncbi:hypothetical protein [Nocardia sp. NPDC050175]|uniref:hypothetical protein n=1 Tax=Nocardia sp. NPDC050175 TaxID=3364317 RepID=UPI00378DDC9F